MKRIWNPMDAAERAAMLQLLPPGSVIVPPDPAMYLHKGKRILELLLKWYTENFKELNEAEVFVTSSHAAGFLELPTIYADKMPSLQALANLHSEKGKTPEKAAQDKKMWEIWALNKINRPQMEYPILCVEVITGKIPIELSRLLSEADQIENSTKLSTFEKGQAKAIVARRMDKALHDSILKILKK